jgi:hypothetical protein
MIINNLKMETNGQQTSWLMLDGGACLVLRWSWCHDVVYVMVDRRLFGFGGGLLGHPSLYELGVGG